jgi:Tfp pilus assembly protein PilF
MANELRPKPPEDQTHQRAVPPTKSEHVAQAPTTTNATPRTLHLKGFLRRLKDIEAQSPDSSLLFVLGSGASRPSGIKTGGEMVADWLEILYREDVAHESVAKDEWPTVATLGISGFDPKDPAASYPQVFSRTYYGRRKEGFDYLEKEIAGRDPSYGYSVLAQILAGTRHNVVVTTNFDNLVIDALSIYTTATPLICGHESLAGFIRTKPSRPQVVKVHRDLFYAPKNASDELGELPPQFADALRSLFATHVPIVIGYGGNDGSLMRVFEEMQPGTLSQGIYWCYRSVDPLPRRQILDMVTKHGGWLVPIKGFDELMIELQDALQCEPLDAFLATRGEERAKNYKERRDALGGTLAAATPPVKTNGAPTPSSDTSQTADALAALQSVLERNQSTRTAEQWDSLAKLEPDPAKRMLVYTKGLQMLPKSAWMHIYAGNFFASSPKTMAEADRLYKEAVLLVPQNAAILGNYANFLRVHRKDLDAAESMYKRALEAESENASNLGNYASFLADIRNDHDAAEAMYKRALAAEPKQAGNLGNYASFLAEIRKSPDAAEAMYKRALEAEPKHANNLGKYANFLLNTREDLDAAEAMLKRALEADPKNASNLGNYANFLRAYRNDHDAAEEVYKRALEVDPKNASNLSNYATFLAGIRNSLDAAEEMYQSALEADPKHVNNLGNYACFHFSASRNVEGLEMLDRAIASLDPSSPTAINAECWMYAYCCRPPKDQLEALARLKHLVVKDGVRTGDWDFAGVITQAKKMGHAESAWLPRLAQVLAGLESPASLDKWSAWAKA